ncbi:MAG TPA: hypothetical protein VFP91_17930 [Vicinamibacterales bacterium]|nr:hypothetical protein [Vicinamibacterales bacterium]
MIWFYTRDQDSLRLETRYDNDALEYVGILTQPDGTQPSRRFYRTAGPANGRRAEDVERLGGRRELALFKRELEHFVH